MEALPKKTRVMLVCMVNSIHVARWISQFDPATHEFILVPSTPTRKSHPIISGLAKTHGHIQVTPFKGRLSQFLWGFDLFLGNRLRAAFIQSAFAKFSPDLIHSLEFQHGGYLAEVALRRLPADFPFLATCYGSDIYWFRKFPKHLKRIKAVLKRANFYSAECIRDVTLAKDLGFQGVVLPVIPNAGGIHKDTYSEKLAHPSERNLVLIKGYDSWVGRGSKAVEAIALLGDSALDFEYVVYSAERNTRRAIKKLPPTLRRRFQVFKKGKLTHAQMMSLFSKALIYVGISESDGISTSLLEAMSMGCFPVQTNTACTSEWFVDGTQGIEVSVIDARKIATSILDALVIARQMPQEEWVRRLNQVREELDYEELAAIARTYYKSVLTE